MFTADKQILSISIADNLIKVALVKSSGSVEKVARIQATSNSPEDLASALKNVLNGFSKKGTVVLTVPAANATSKSIEVPSVDPQEIKSIIGLQASRHTPYSREEIIISYSSMGSADNNGTRVMLVIVHRNFVKERLTLCEKVGLNPDKVIFAPEAMARFYIKALNQKKDSAPCGLVDVALNGITYSVIAKGSPAFTRHIPIGVKAIMEGADTQTKLIEEFNKSISGFVNEDIDLPPEKYLVTTDHEAVKNILPSLNQQLAVDFQLSPFTNFIKASAAIKRKLIAEFADESFLDVVAAGIYAFKADANLMPDEVITRKQFEQQSKEVSKAGVAGVLLMVLFGAIILTKIYFKDEFLNKNLREKYASAREEVKMLEATQQKNHLVRQYLNDRMISLDTLNALYEVTPKEIYLGNIGLDDQGTMTIDGVSDSMSRVFAFVKALEDAPMFKTVKTKSTATKKEKGKDVAAFEITMKIEQGTKP